MSDESKSYNVREADVFSRGSLKMTYDLIRKVTPELALQVRNISGGEVLPKSLEDLDNKHSDHFRVVLDSFQVRAVVEALMESAIGGGGDSNPGKVVMAQALIEDWVKLAQKMVSELPEDQRPPSYN